MQIYTHFEQISKTPSKSAFLGSFCNFSVPFPPPWAKVLFFPCRKNPNLPSPPAGPFPTPLLPPTTACPSMRTGLTPAWWKKGSNDNNMSICPALTSLALNSDFAKVRSPLWKKRKTYHRFSLGRAPHIVKKRDKHVFCTIGIFSPEVFVFPTGVSHFLEAIPRNPTWARSNFEGGGSKFRSRDWGSKKMLREGYRNIF